MLLPSILSCLAHLRSTNLQQIRFVAEFQLNHPSGGKIAPTLLILPHPNASVSLALKLHLHRLKLDAVAGADVIAVGMCRPNLSQ